MFVAVPRLSLLILLPACVACVVALPARAFNDPPPPRIQQAGDARDVSSARRSRVHDSMSDSVRRIERSTRGRVLSAERMQFDGRDLNRIKVLDSSGRVRIYVDDPQSRRGPVRARGDDD